MSKLSQKAKRIAASAFLVGVLAVSGAALAHADTSGTKTDPMTTLATTIAQKFNLNASDVQSVIDTVMQQERAKHEQEHAQMEATRLKSAVAAGTLTQAQADLITAKEAELKAARAAGTKPTQADIQSLKQWAIDNDIPTEVMFGGMRGPHDGHHPGQFTTTQ